MRGLSAKNFSLVCSIQTVRTGMSSFLMRSVPCSTLLVSGAVMLLPCPQYFADDPAEIVVGPLPVFFRIDVALRELRGEVFCSEQHVNPVVDRALGDQIPDVALFLLRNPVDAVLRLQIIVKAE